MKINNATSNIALKLINRNNNIPKKSVAFTGVASSNLYKEGERFLKGFFKLNRQGTMTRNLFIFNAYVFLLGSRLITSRDKDEKRETLTRDVPTIFIAAQGLPIIKTWAAKQIQKKTGIALFEDIDKSSSIVSSSELNDWYKYDENLKSGFDGFLNRLDGLGGSLKKICSSLGTDIKSKLIDFSDDNESFKAELVNDNRLEEIIKEAFKSDNKVLAKANWLRTVPAVAGLGLTLGLIGIFIPKFNIALTEHINKDKKNMELDKTV